MSFEIVPTPLGSTSMTKVGSRGGFNIEFIQIAEFVVGWFDTKGTFPHYNVGSIEFGGQSMRLTIGLNDQR
jgi:hypothetical protein